MINENQPLTINIDTYGFDEKTIAMLKYAFRQFEKFRVEILSGNSSQQADILLFDIDEESARSQWKNLTPQDKSGENVDNKAVPESVKQEKGIISLSYQPMEMEFGVSIVKPLSKDKLFHAVEQCVEKCLHRKTLSAYEQSSQQMDDSNQPVRDVKAKKGTASSDINNPVKHSDKELESQLQEQAKRSSETVLTEEMFFDHNKGLLGALSQIYQEKTAALIYLTKDQHGLFYVLPESNSIYVMVSGTEIKNICVEQIKVGFSELEHHSFDANKIAQPNRKFHLDYFVWLIALMTGRGRIPVAINAGNNQLGLRHWPNLTRYKSSPDFLRFAAFFTQTPTNFVLAQKLLNPPRGQLANFICACYALGILRIEQPNGTTDTSNRAREKPPKYKKIIGQIFSRLFKSK